MLTMLLPERPTSEVNLCGGDLKLLDGVLGKVGERAADYFVVVVAAIDGDVAASSEAACGADFEGVRLGRVEGGRWAVSGNEIGELKKVSAVQRNALDRLRCDLTLNHGLGEIDRVVDFADVDDCVCAGGMETDVDSLCSAGLENDAVGFGNGEAGAFDLQVIGANFEGGEDVETFCIRQGLARYCPGPCW